MARSNAGKWVARAAATGGGRTYRGNAPVNWYAALVLIVILGIVSVVYSNYEYRHSSATGTTTTQPTIKQTWYAALAFDICGTQRTSLPSNAGTTPTKLSFYTTGTGIITIAPKTALVAGKNAVLGKFVSGYKGLAVSATALKFPASSVSTTTTTTAPSHKKTHKAHTKRAKKTKATTSTTAKGSTTTSVPKATTSTTAAATTTAFKNGQTCPKGTKDAGKTGQIEAYTWKNALTTKEKPTVVSGDPATIRFSQNQEITIGFVPAGTKLPRPTGTIVKALLAAAESSPTTATTAPATTAPTTSLPTSAGSTPSASTTPAATASTTTTAP